MDEASGLFLIPGLSAADIAPGHYGRVPVPDSTHFEVFGPPSRIALVFPNGTRVVVADKASDPVAYRASLDAMGLTLSDDGDEPVTEEWLRSEGWAGAVNETWSRGAISVWKYPCGWYVSVGCGNSISFDNGPGRGRGPLTMSRVRQMLALFAATPTEGT